MKVAIYARYSSSSQREASIEEQIKVCTDYAIRNKYSIVKTYSDSAISGRTDKRPGLQRLLKDCEKHTFDAVLVYSIDRFNRNLRKSLDDLDILYQNNVSLLSITEHFNATPSGNYFLHIMMSNAQFYSDDLAEKIQRGMDYNGEHCLSTGGNIALGFKVNKDKQFEVDFNTAPIVQKVFEMYADGKTITEIINHLNSMGYKTSRGIPFNKNSLHTMLKNKRYIGVYTYKGNEIPNGMPRIISDELFNRVAEKMKTNKKAPARARAKVEYLLTTKLFCGKCKEMMTGFSATGHQGIKYNYYICNGRKAKQCDKATVSKTYIEDLVVNQCRKLLTPKNIERIAKEVSELCEAERDTSNFRFLQNQLATIQRKYTNATNAILETDSQQLRANLYEQIELLEAQQKQVETAIQKETEPLPSLTEPKIMFFLNSLRKGNVNDIKYRKLLIKLFVNKIFLYDDRLTISFNTGDDTVEINDRLLADMEAHDNEIKNLFIDGDAPPNGKDT